MDGPKRSQMRVRLRVTARRRGDGVDGAGGSGAGGRKRRLDAPVLNSAAKLLRREIGGRQLAAFGGGPASAVPERFRNMQLQVCRISSRWRLLGLGRLGFRSCSGECRPPGGGGIVGACDGGDRFSPSLVDLTAEIRLPSLRISISAKRVIRSREEKVPVLHVPVLLPFL
jgi:hypothetical protein